MAPSELQMLLIQQHAESKLKYMYFLVAADGAAIGFVVQQLGGMKFDDAGLWMLLSGALLLFGFMSGCFALHKEVMEKVHSVREARLKQNVTTEVREGISRDWNQANKGMMRGIRWMFAFMVAGAGCAVVARLMEMMSRS